MKYVVTGGAGFIGSNLAKELAKRGETTVVDDLSTGRIENMKDLIHEGRLRFVRGSVTDLDLLRRVFQSTDYVLHQAAIPSAGRSVENPLRTNEVNIHGTLNVLLAAKECNVEKVVYASSSSVYGENPSLPKTEDMIPSPKSPYAVSKLTGEYYCRVFREIYSLETVCLRYFNVYGPRQDPFSEYAAVIPKFVRRALENRAPIIYGDGKQTRDFTFVMDVVKANILGTERGKGVYNIGSGKRVTINDLAKKVMKMLGKNLTPIYEPARPYDIMHSLADISRARNELNYDPEFDLERGLKETIEYLDHGAQR